MNQICDFLQSSRGLLMLAGVPLLTISPAVQVLQACGASRLLIDVRERGLRGVFRRSGTSGSS